MSDAKVLRVPAYDAFRPDELGEAAHRLLPAIESLSVHEQDAVSDYLCEYTEDADDPEEVRRSWDETIRRRIAEIESGVVQPVPAEEVFRRLNEKYL